MHSKYYYSYLYQYQRRISDFTSYSYWSAVIMRSIFLNLVLIQWILSAVVATTTISVSSSRGDDKKKKKLHVNL